MISETHILKQKLLFSTQQSNAWRLRRTTETDPKRKETINLIIDIIEDDKSLLRLKIHQKQNAQ